VKFELTCGSKIRELHDNATVHALAFRMARRRRPGPLQFGTHFLRRTKATSIYKRTADPRAVHAASLC
jgi:hypothetical protein